MYQMHLSATEEATRNLSIKELKDLLTASEIKFSSSDNKQDLLSLALQVQEEAINEDLLSLEYPKETTDPVKVLERKSVFRFRGAGYQETFEKDNLLKAIETISILIQEDFRKISKAGVKLLISKITDESTLSSEAMQIIKEYIKPVVKKEKKEKTTEIVEDEAEISGE